MVFQILEAGPSQINTQPINPDAAQLLRENLIVSPGQFAVILVGKDGGVKLHRQEETQLDDIFGLIDSMPMGQEEMRRKEK